VDEDEACALRLLETASILVHPGSFFDIPGNGHLVLSLLVPQEIFISAVRQALPIL
jgi:aspartate/methionine/tyrosine aminotransferase